MLPSRSFRARLTASLVLFALASGALTTLLALWIGGMIGERLAKQSDEATFALLVDSARHAHERGHPMAIALTPPLDSAASSLTIDITILADEDHHVLASSDLDLIGQPFPGGPQWTTASIADDDGSAGLVAMRRVPGTWRRAMVMPSSLGLVLITSSLSLAAIFCGRMLSRRLERLYREAKQLTKMPPGVGRDEVSAIGYALDDQKRAAEASRLENRDRDRQIRALSDDLPVGMSYVDQELRMIFLNRTLEGWLGWKRQALLGRRLSDFMPPDQFQETLRGIEPSLRGSKVQRERDFVIDGKPAVIASINIPDRDPSGRVRGVFSLLRDVTQRRAQETERDRLFSELAAKNSELERFSYTVSHDLKGPLTTIVGSADLIGLALQSGDVGSVEGDLERIRDTAATMRQMLDELLDLARVGLVANQETRVDLRQLTAETLRLLSGSIDRYGTRTILSEDLPVALGDRQRLQRVLQNLIDNAVKFSAGVEQPEVEVGCREVGGETVIFVRDNGCGIPPRQQARVFDLFSKLDGESEGTGIGLAIVHRIITGHRGRIWVESAGAGQGTSFCFTLPLAPTLDEPTATGPGEIS